MSNHEILLVEDNDDDIELTVHAFRQCKVPNSIVVAKDGESALDYLFRTGAHANRRIDDQPALVLLDLKLPGICGLDVLRRLRETPDTRRIPVVILTTSDDAGDIARGYDLGVNSYIRKPVGFRAFAGMVERLGDYWLATNTRAPAFGHE